MILRSFGAFEKMNHSVEPSSILGWNSYLQGFTYFSTNLQFPQEPECSQDINKQKKKHIEEKINLL